MGDIITQEDLQKARRFRERLRKYREYRKKLTQVKTLEVNTNKPEKGDRTG